MPVGELTMRSLSMRTIIFSILLNLFSLVAPYRHVVHAMPHNGTKVLSITQPGATIVSEANRSWQSERAEVEVFGESQQALQSEDAEIDREMLQASHSDNGDDSLSIDSQACPGENFVTVGMAYNRKETVNNAVKEMLPKSPKSPIRMLPTSPIRMLPKGTVKKAVGAVARSGVGEKFAPTSYKAVNQKIIATVGPTVTKQFWNAHITVVAGQSDQSEAEKSGMVLMEFRICGPVGEEQQRNFACCTAAKLTQEKGKPKDLDKWSYKAANWLLATAQEWMPEKAGEFLGGKIVEELVNVLPIEMEASLAAEHVGLPRVIVWPHRIDATVEAQSPKVMYQSLEKAEAHPKPEQPPPKPLCCSCLPGKPAVEAPCP